MNCTACRQGEIEKDPGYDIQVQWPSFDGLTISLLNAYFFACSFPHFILALNSLRETRMMDVYMSR